MQKNYRTPFNLINLTHVGISVADYPEIRDAVANRFKEIYGSDIDLSTGSADGVYVEMFALIINNTLQTLKTLYSDLDINTAAGIFLDNLCALSGVYRKSATYSSAVLVIKLLDNNPITISNTNPLSFSDKGGAEWRTRIELGQELTIQPNVETNIIVYCTEPGPVKATPGWIDKLLSQEINMTISQPNYGELGAYAETDVQLRARRAESISTKGISVLQSLSGALLNLTGINDVKIYNNDTNSNITSLDDSTLKPHSIYVVIAKNKNVEIDDSIIGSIIYEKLTPGIGTNEYKTTVEGGISKSYQYNQYVLGINYNDTSLLQMIYWKECVPVTTDLTLTINMNKKQNYSSIDTKNIILNQVIEYMNNLGISEKFTKIDVINQINDVDPMFRGQKTYQCTDIEFTYDESDPDFPFFESGTGITTSYYTKDTIIDWTNATINEVISGDVITLTIKVEK